MRGRWRGEGEINRVLVTRREEEDLRDKLRREFERRKEENPTKADEDAKRRDQQCRAAESW